MQSYSVQAVLSAVDKNFTSTLSKAKKLMGGLEGAADKSKSSILGIASGIGVFSLVSKGIGAVTSSVGAAIDRFDTLNNYPKVMVSLGYGADEAKQSIDKLSKGIDGLPTTLDGIAKSAQMLTASIGDIGKGTDTAIALNNMFLAGGQGADAASRALTQYNQILARGKIGQQEWNTLLEVAPAQMDQLAKSMLGGEANASALRDALMNGTISIDQFNDAIIRLNEEGSGEIESFADQAIKATGGIATAISVVKSAITRGLANSLSAIDAALKSSNLPTMAKMISDLKPKIDGIFAALNTNLPKVGKNIAIVFASVLSAGGVGGIPILSKISMISAAIGAFGAIQHTFGPQLYKLTQTASREGPKIITNLVEGITSQLPLLIDQGMILIQNLANAIIANLPILAQGAASILLALVTGLTENIDSIVTAAVQIIFILAQTLLNNLPQIVTAMFDLMVALGGAIIDNLPMIFEAIRAVGQAILYSLGELALAMLEKGWELIKNLASGIWDTIGPAVTAMGDVIRGIIDKIVSFFSELTAKGREIVDKIKTGITNKVSAAKNAIKEVLDGIKSKITEYINRAKNWGRDLVNGIASGIRNAIGAVKEAASSVGNAIKSFLHFSRPDTGPLRPYEQWMPDMMRGLAKGIIDNLPIVERAADKIAEVIASTQTAIDNFAAGDMRMGAQLQFAGDYSYGLNTTSLGQEIIEALETRPLVINQRTTLDGRELAKSSTSYIEDEMGLRAKIDNYTKGIRQ